MCWHSSIAFSTPYWQSLCTRVSPAANFKLCLSSSALTNSWCLVTQKATIVGKEKTKVTSHLYCQSCLQGDGTGCCTGFVLGLGSCSSWSLNECLHFLKFAYTFNKLHFLQHRETLCTNRVKDAHNQSVTFSVKWKAMLSNVTDPWNSRENDSSLK